MGSATPDYNTRNLTQLLRHLDRNLSDSTTSADGAPLPAEQQQQQHQKPTVTSPFDRQRVRANFEHARALLLRLEHESTGIRVASRKHAVQADLRAKREQVKRLQLRVQALDDAAEGGASEDEEDEADVDTEVHRDSAGEMVTIAVTNSGHETNAGMRRRGGGDEAHLAAYSTSTPGARGPTTTTTLTADGDAGAAATKDQVLSSDRQEQEQIMTSLLALTRQLKTSAAVFSGSLESEKALLDKAAQGLDRNVDGMDAAGRRMGTLRKMTEGKGFFARLKLYGFIAVLWLVALVMVFVLPKLRF